MFRLWLFSSTVPSPQKEGPWITLYRCQNSALYRTLFARYDGTGPRSPSRPSRHAGQGTALEVFWFQHKHCTTVTHTHRYIYIYICIPHQATKEAPVQLSAKRHLPQCWIMNSQRVSYPGAGRAGSDKCPHQELFKAQLKDLEEPNQGGRWDVHAPKKQWSPTY